jgi:uncharacterized RDD family membrane protein YckC
MMTAEEYIAGVMDRMPRGTPMREQIADELRSAIADRMAQGRTLEEVLRQLGDQERLAESYLAAVPLESADIGDRIGAKVVDFFVSLLILAPLLALCFSLFPLPPEFPRFIAICLGTFIGSGLVMSIYGVIAEYKIGTTVGKRLMGCRVVRERGTRISLGQSMVRHLPVLLQVIWVDALFMFFTDHKQRAFELLSRTRVVRTIKEDL